MRLVCLLVSLALHLGGLALAWKGLPPAGPALAMPQSTPVRLSPPPDTLPGQQGPREPTTASLQEEPVIADTSRPSAGIKEISPVKRGASEVKGIWIGKGELKQGAELSLSMRSLAGFDFSLEEFCGYYLIRGSKDHVLSVIDGRKTYGKLLLHDSATGTLRALTRYSKYIFTYSGSFAGSTPVEGSITFLPRKDFERTPNVDDRSLLLWIPKDPPAVVAVRFDFIEERIRYHYLGAEREAVLIALRDGGRCPALVFAGNPDCAEQELYRGFARLMAANGVAVLITGSQDCLGPDGIMPGGSTNVSPLELVQAWRTLAAHRKVLPGRVGYFGYGRGADAAGLAAVRLPPAFCLLALDDKSGGTLPLPSISALGRKHIPALAVLTSDAKASAWSDDVRELIRKPPSSISVLTADIASGWTDPREKHHRFLDLAPYYVQTVTPWIAGMDISRKGKIGGHLQSPEVSTSEWH